MNCVQNIAFNFFQQYNKLLINPDNRKLQYFHLIVAITLFFDFFITGLILGNFLFLTGEQEDFINHERNYVYICIIQGTDILLNFFKGDYKKKSKGIFLSYVKGNFLTDMIALVPYSLLIRPLIFLRYLKLLKYNVYLKYLEDYVL